VKLKKIVLILGLIFLFSCDKEEQISRKIPDGNYTSTFKREFVWFDCGIANITMTFSSNKWTGESERVKYPALCKGTYKIIGDTIIFENECGWTAEFDWSLILAGKYVLKQTENVVEFSRDYCSATNDTYIDRYIIKREQ
jgi:hypothetical protein